MPHAIDGFVAIKCFNVTIEFGRVCSGKTTRNLVGRNEIFRRSINFHAITGAEQQRLVATAVSQYATGFGVAGEILTRFHVGIVMAETDAKQIHGTCVWAVKVIPQRRVNAALKPMMLSTL